jgi:hypothetical protein
MSLEELELIKEDAESTMQKASYILNLTYKNKSRQSHSFNARWYFSRLLGSPLNHQVANISVLMQETVSIHPWKKIC